MQPEFSHLQRCSLLSLVNTEALYLYLQGTALLSRWPLRLLPSLHISFYGRAEEGGGGESTQAEKLLLTAVCMDTVSTPLQAHSVQRKALYWKVAVGGRVGVGSELESVRKRGLYLGGRCIQTPLNPALHRQRTSQPHTSYTAHPSTLYSIHSTPLNPALNTQCTPQCCTPYTAHLSTLHFIHSTPLNSALYTQRTTQP